MKNKIVHFSLILLTVLFIIVVSLIIIKYSKNRINDNKLHSVVDEFNSRVAKNDNNNVINNIEREPINIEYNGYNVLGIITIPKIGIEYPILDTTNDKTMKIAITKFWGCNVNEIGNFTMAGHNNLDGTMFGKTKKLEIGDRIFIKDLYGVTLEYEIFDKYLIDPNDVSCVKSVENNTKEITLLTCANRKK